MTTTPQTEWSRQDLVDAWKRAHGAAPPKGIGSRLLALAAAYHIQANAEGGLRPDTRKAILRFNSVSRTAAPDGSKAIRPGTRLIRHWHGEAHVVDIMHDGVLYRGETFKSLSEVARRITGAKWSGPRFFGLKRP